MSEGVLSPAADGRRKLFVLDTSTLMHAPECVDPKRDTFQDNEVVIPLMALRELDGLKTDLRRGSTARAVIRLIDETFPTRQLMHEGVRTAGGGIVRISGISEADGPLPKEYARTSADDYMLRLAGGLQKKRGGNMRVILISKDLSLRVRARAANIEAQDLQTGKVERPQTLAPHIIDIELSSVDIDELYRQRYIDTSELALPFGIYPNACCRLFDQKTGKPALGIFRAGDRIEVVSKEKGGNGKRGIAPRNAEQLFAYELSVRPDILVATLVGIAGTGKTLMALKAAVDLLENPASPIKRIICFRPMIELGEKMGYLPGDVDEKFAPWASAIHGNLQLLFSRGLSMPQEHDDAGENGNGSNKKNGDGNGKKKHDKLESGRDKLARYLREETISVQPVTYVRGTTFPNAFLIVDEAQNLTAHEIMALLTRAGDGSMAVLTGDLTQIDSPHLDAASCGLAKTLELTRGRPEFGAIELVKGERSVLATIAAEIFAGA